MTVYLLESGLRNYENALAELGAAVSYTEPDDCSALLLQGGGDVCPALYGREDRGSVFTDPERDRRETEAIELFLRTGRPILGICRGAQMLNVYFGGTLIQDIPGHGRVNGEDSLHYTRTDDPFLISVYSERFIVNSAHHQAVERLGEGLRAVQWADDGTVEAIRHETMPVFAVQWHPERMRSPEDGRKLLKSWLEACVRPL